MAYRFLDWFACPECGGQEKVSTLAHQTDIIFECHECGLISEYRIGRDISLQNLDIDAITELADDEP